MKIEAGKFYRLRNGIKCFALGKSPFTELFVVDWEEPKGGGAMYGENGLLGGHFLGEGSEYDIVSEWEEPKAPRVIEMYVSIYASSNDTLDMLLWSGEDEKGVRESHAESVKSISLRKIRYTEGGKVEDVTDEN